MSNVLAFVGLVTPILLVIGFFVVVRLRENARLQPTRAATPASPVAEPGQEAAP